MEFVNDIGKPWRFEDEGLTVTRSCVWSPPGCHPVGCGVKFYADAEGKLVKVEGDENQPVTKGRLCVRCLTLKDYVNHPDRIKYPMKRDPQFRGQADKWERISWEEAFDLIESEWKRITGKYGPTSVAVWAGTGREGGTFMPYAAAIFATPNYCYTQSGYACYLPRMAASAYVLGAVYPEIDFAGGLEGTYDNPEFVVPEVIMLVGKDPLPSNPDGFFGHSVIDLMKRGAKLITVDPRSNWVSTRAEYNLRLRPGTDTALLMAMLNVIIDEDLYDHEWVEKWTYGFEQLAERVQAITPAIAAEICDVPEEDIIGAARMYAAAKPASIAWGLATDQKANGQQMAHCVMALMAITGNIDVPGGNIIGGFADSLNEPGFGFSIMSDETKDALLGLHDYPAYCGMLLNAHADLMLKALETEEPYPIKMGLFAGNNLVACTSAEPRRWHDAMIKSLEFNIGFDVWMTPSVQATCDLMLPLPTVAERDGIVFTHYSSLPVTYGVMTPAIVRVGETKSDMEFGWELGHRLQPDFWNEQFTDFTNFIEKFRLQGNISLEDAREKVCVQRGHTYRKYEKGLLRGDGALGFNTPTGRVELWSTMFQRFGDDPLPYYEEPQYSPLSTPELLEDYPFVLTSGARRYEYFHSEGRQIPYLREIHPEPTFDIHPVDAEALGISQNDMCILENQYGFCELRANLSPIVKPGVVHADHGWWYPEEDPNEPHLYGVFRSNVNNLVPNFHFGKMGFGAPFKCILCSVKKGSLADKLSHEELIAGGYDRPAVINWKEGRNA
ncbi:MAG: molybdopterin-dependent oxidoreductase [Eggerthellaceae bacterium]|nr:molybdopterin-dependent oxidoreductase [Eggerthellaceae bacterium]